MEAIVRAATALFLNQEVRITYWSVVILLMLPRSHAWPEPSLSSSWSRSGSARRVAWLPCDVNVTRTPPLDITDSWTASLPSHGISQLDMFSASPVFRLIFVFDRASGDGSTLHCWMRSQVLRHQEWSCSCMQSWTAGLHAASNSGPPRRSPEYLLDRRLCPRKGHESPEGE